MAVAEIVAGVRGTTGVVGTGMSGAAAASTKQVVAATGVVDRKRGPRPRKGPHRTQNRLPVSAQRRADLSPRASRWPAPAGPCHRRPVTALSTSPSISS